MRSENIESINKVSNIITEQFDYSVYLLCLLHIFPMKKLLAITFIVMLFVQSTFAYRLTIKDEKVLQGLYKKIDVVYDTDNDQFDRIHRKLEKVLERLQTRTKAYVFLAEVDEYMDFLEKPKYPTIAPKPPLPPQFIEIDLTELETFYETAYIYGPEDAKITIIEFSDFQCPFCARHHTQWTLDQVMNKYEWDINIIFAHYPLNFHQLAQKAAEASECVAEQGGWDAFYAFQDGIFAEDQPDRTAIERVVKSIEWINREEVATCIDNGDFAQKVQDQMDFWRTKLGVTGTPGNIVMNNATGVFKKVSGAVPASAFDGVIENFLE